MGDAVAIVAGKTEEAVEKALKLIKVKYEVLEAVLDFHQAKDAKILVHPEENWKALCDVGADNKRNLCATGSEQNGDVDKILEDCVRQVAVCRSARPCTSPPVHRTSP